MKATLYSEVLKHISQLKQYQAALSVFDQIKAERSKFEKFYKEAKSKRHESSIINLVQKLELFINEFRSFKVGTAFHKWIMYSQRQHLYHVYNHKLHEVKHKLKHEHHKAIQEIKEHHEVELSNQTRLHEAVRIEQDTLIQKIESSRSLAATRYLSDICQRYFYR